MKIVDVGTGPPLVLIPGIQGRWEWMRPAVQALAQHCRVITFSLADERTADATFNLESGFGNYVDQVREALDKTGVASATVCGVSYGGLIASAFAARHPTRVNGVVLVSAIPPSWRPDSRVRFYLRAPRVLAPLFCIGSLRLYREIAAATPGVFTGIAAALRHGFTAITHMFSPVLMAQRVRLLETIDLTRELRSVQAPVLVITGQPDLERVVPVRLTLEYLTLWPHAQSATLASTGHLGLVTRPERFAELVMPFVQSVSNTPESRRRLG
jgi:pimeloyl-ACP methyl ester carboxylesterase